MEHKNIVLIGMPGCGKSTIARLLSKKINMNYIDVDKYIEGKTRQTINELFTLGENHFRDIETSICKEISELDDLIISTGGGVVKRKENIENLKSNGIVIFIDRPLENILSDLETDDRPLLKEGKEKLILLYNERYNLYNEYCDIKVLNNSSLECIVNSIISELGLLNINI